MKLATLHDGSRDGQLLVVSRDLALAHHASHIAGSLQAVLDDWNFLAPQLQDLASTLEGGKARHAFPFEPRACLAPLPRAYQWVHAADPPAEGESGPPPLVQRGADPLWGPAGAASAARLEGDAAAGVPGGAAFGCVLGDLPAGASPEAALEAVRLITWLRLLGSGGGLWAPLAVTPDELGAAWADGRVLAAPDAAVPRRGHFGTCIAAAAATRPIGAGCIVSAAWESAPAAASPNEWRAADGSSVFGALGPA